MARTIASFVQKTFLSRKLVQLNLVSKMSSVKISWKRVVDADETSRPISRSSHGLSFISDNLYLFGGEHEARTPIDSRLYSINLSSVESTSWRLVDVSAGEIPPPRVAHSQCRIDDKIYFFGGRQGKCIDEQPLNDFHIFDTKNKTWTKVENCEGQFPCPRSYHAMASIGKSIFIFGGCGPEGNRLSDLHEFEVEKNLWISHGDGPMAGRGGAGLLAASNNKQLFVVGGFAGKEMDDIFSYDLETQTWSQIQPGLPEPRSVFVHLSVGSNQVIFGGEMSPSQKGHEGAGNFFGSLLVFEEKDRRLKLKEVELEHEPDAEPSPRGWTSGVAIGINRFAVFGGLTGDDSDPQRLDDLWICDLKDVD